MTSENRIEKPTSRGDVLRILQIQLAEILEIQPETINEGASFTDDLDADSLALIELVEALEEVLEEFSPGFHIDDEDLEDLLTIRDSVDYISDKLGLS